MEWKEAQQVELKVAYPELANLASLSQHADGSYGFQLVHR